MQKFDHPLDKIHVASPCSADWDQMYGNSQKRFCSDCKLNVYNLSGMTRGDAEALLMRSEGNLCVRYYRRADGTILTQDCPVGWQAVRRRISRVAAAAFSIVAGFFAGIGGVDLLQRVTGYINDHLAISPVEVPIAPEPPLRSVVVVGEVDRESEQWYEGRSSLDRMYVGRIDNALHVERLRKIKKLK